MKKVLLLFIFLSSFSFAYEELNLGNFNEKLKGKNAIVDFYANWCAPCKVIAKNLEEFDELKDQNVTIYKVNIDKEYFLADMNKAKALPTLLFFKNGKEVKRTIGVQSSQKILELSEKLF